MRSTQQPRFPGADVPSGIVYSTLLGARALVAGLLGKLASDSRFTTRVSAEDSLTVGWQAHLSIALRNQETHRIIVERESHAQEPHPNQTLTAFHLEPITPTIIQASDQQRRKVAQVVLPRRLDWSPRGRKNQ